MSLCGWTIRFCKSLVCSRGRGGSSEYYNECADFLTYKSIPKNTGGYQWAKTSRAYAGCGFTLSPLTNWREFAETRLTQTLDSGKSYKVEFYISLADKSKYAIEAIGVYFSKDTITWSALDQNYHHPQVLNQNGYISDTANWVLISGIYYAKGGEQFITLGNFNINTPFNYKVINSNGWEMAYYYIDDVSVYPVNTPVYKAECGNDNILCLGDSIQLGTQKLEQYEYFWFAMGNEKDTLSKSAMPYFSPDTTTTYVLKMLDFKFDWSSDTVTIKVVECGKPTKLNVYPNPTYGELILEFNKPILTQTSISFYNMLGQKIQSFSLQSNAESKSAKVNLSGLSSGLYFYQVGIEGEESFKGKIVLLN
ncbi:MAG: T9SS type A sorting domain-containing protein [Saprospiraceae bacterium]|nr:T9SS type A sorting domain-containing protein [Saprospiraceae bacterium]